MVKRNKSTIAAEQHVHPTDQKDSQAEKVDKKLAHKKVAPEKGRVLRYVKWTAKWLWKVTLFLGFLLGIVSGYAGLLQRISVSQNGELDPNDPFSSPFIISNDGPLPIENVRFRCGIGHTKYENGPEIKGGADFGTTFIFLPDKDGKLPIQNFGSSEMNPGERSTIPSCAYPFPKSVAVADIGIVVTFRIGYTPISGERIFRFSTLADANKKLHWYPLPLK